MLTVIIKRDDDHIDHAANDLRISERNGWIEDAERAREELANLEDGTWTAYGVTVAEMCEHCDSVIDAYVTALWGCVVEADDAVGRYDDPDKIKDAYLREVAFGLLYEAREKEVESDG